MQERDAAVANVAHFRQVQPEGESFLAFLVKVMPLNHEGFLLNLG